MARRWTPIATAALIWAVNPTLGGCDEPAFSFGEAEMLALLDTLNSEAWTDGNHSIDFELEQASTAQAMIRAPWSLLRTAHACGDRSFVAEAAACLDTSTLPLTGTVTVTDLSSGESVTSDLSVSGELLVVGYELTNADVSLRHSTGSFELYSSDGVEFSLTGSSW